MGNKVGFKSHFVTLKILCFTENFIENFLRDKIVEFENLKIIKILVKISYEIK